MAVSLGFGILFATLLTLVLIPTFYLIVEDIKRLPSKVLALINAEEDEISDLAELVKKPS